MSRTCLSPFEEDYEPYISLFREQLRNEMASMAGMGEGVESEEQVFMERIQNDDAYCLSYLQNLNAHMFMRSTTQNIQPSSTKSHHHQQQQLFPPHSIHYLDFNSMYAYSGMFFLLLWSGGCLLLLHSLYNSFFSPFPSKRKNKCVLCILLYIIIIIIYIGNCFPPRLL